MAVKHTGILQAIRAEIVSGVYPAGALLPQRVEYEKRFGATAPTVQRAFNQLREDGFIEIRHRVGTFVTQQPPHRFRYALVFPHAVGTHGWSRYAESLRQQALVLERERGIEIVCYHVGFFDPRSEGAMRLAADLEAQRVAGIIHMTSYWAVSAPSLCSPDVPMVIVASTNAEQPGLGVVGLEYDSILDVGIRSLAEQGCRRIAVVQDVETGGYSEPGPAILEPLARYGLSLAEHGYIAVPMVAADAVRHWIKLLLDRPEAVRPDGLLLTDDNFVEPVTRGLVEAGVRTGPGFFPVVTHNNFPLPLSRAVPVYQVGYHAGQLLSLAIAYIDGCKSGTPPPSFVAVRAKTEDELRREKSAGAGRRPGQGAFGRAPALRAEAMAGASGG